MYIKKMLFTAACALFIKQELSAFKILNFTKYVTTCAFVKAESNEEDSNLYHSLSEWDMYVIELQPYTTHVFDIDKAFKASAILMHMSNLNGKDKNGKPIFTVFLSERWKEDFITNDWGIVIQEHMGWDTASDVLVKGARWSCMPSKALCEYKESLLKKQEFTTNKSKNGIVHVVPNKFQWNW